MTETLEKASESCFCEKAGEWGVFVKRCWHLMAKSMEQISEMEEKSQSTHRVVIADFWRTSHLDGKISPGWWGWEGGGGVHARGLQFYTCFGISIGIKRRMIDLGKKITFYFLQNVWKCKVFSHLHFKIAKSAIMTQKKIFLKNINTGIKKTQNFMLISNSLMPAFRKAPNKSYKQKTTKKCTKTKILKIRLVFWL